jgi:hypothetical protein
MPSREGSNLRPLWRFCHASNKQKVTQGGRPPQKDVKNEGRSGDIYENKGQGDNLTDSNSGICAQSKPILPKITDCEGPFAARVPRRSPSDRKSAKALSYERRLYAAPWAVNLLLRHQINLSPEIGNCERGSTALYSCEPASTCHERERKRQQAPALQSCGRLHIS